MSVFLKMSCVKLKGLAQDFFLGLFRTEDAEVTEAWRFRFFGFFTEAAFFYKVLIVSCLSMHFEILKSEI